MYYMYSIEYSKDTYMKFYFVRTKNAYNIMAFMCNIYNYIIKEKIRCLHESNVNGSY